MKVLVIEDDAGIADLIRENLEELDYQVSWVESFDDADKYIETTSELLMIVDYYIAGGVNAQEWLTVRQKENRHIPPFIVSTGQGDERIAVNMMKLGAKDYLIKDTLLLERLPEVLKRVRIELENEQKLRLAEQKILEMSEHFKALIENASDGVVLIDVDGNFKYISPSARKMFGYSVTDDIEGHPNDFTHPDDLPMVLTHLAKLFENPDYKPTFEYRFKSKDGEWKWIESTFNNMLNNPNVQAIVINFRDVNERKLAEIALSEGKEMLDKVLFFSSEFIDSDSGEIDFSRITESMIDLSGARYASFNLFEENGLDFRTLALCGINNASQMAMNVLGFDLRNKKWSHDPFRAEKIKDKVITEFNSLHDLIGAVLPTVVVKAIQKTVNIEKVFVVKTNNRNKSIGDFTLLFHKGETIRNKEIVELFASQIGQYIARKRAEETLRESERKYRLLFAENPQPMWIFDIETLAFLEVNQAAIEHYGYSKEEFLSMSLVDIRPGEDVPFMMNHVSQLKQGSKSQHFARHIKKNGELMHVELTSATTVSKGRDALHILVNDVTERKKAEEELKEKMDELLRFQRVTVGRELAMIELKKEINELSKRLGEEERYKIIE